MNGLLSLKGTLGKNKQKTGICKLKISEMKVGKVSPIANVLKVLSMDRPEDFNFEQMLIDSYIKNDRIDFKKVDLSGDSVAFKGAGKMNLKTKKINLILTARGIKADIQNPSVLQSLTEVLGHAVVKMEIKGTYSNPNITTETLPILHFLK